MCTGTAVIHRSSAASALSFIDIDVDRWNQTRTDFVSSTDFDLTLPIDFTQNAVNDSRYSDDLVWLQNEVFAANKNDRVAGSCPFAVPYGWNGTYAPCRYSECELGNWWSKVVYDYIALTTQLDIAFHNGGALRKGWPKGLPFFHHMPFPLYSNCVNAYGRNVAR